MTWDLPTLLLAPDWRTRRAALDDWLVCHESAIRAGRAIVWVDNGAAAERLNYALAKQFGVLWSPPARTTATLAHGLLGGLGIPSETVGRGAMLAYVSAALALDRPALQRYHPFRFRPRTCDALAGMLERLRGEEPDAGRWFALWGAEVPHRRADLEALAALQQEVEGLLAADGLRLPSAINLAAADAVERAGLPGIEALCVWDAVRLGAADRVLLQAVLGHAGVAHRAAILPGGQAPDEALRLADPIVAVCREVGLREVVLAAAPLPAIREVLAPTPTRALEVALREVAAWLREDDAHRPERAGIVLPELMSLAATAYTLAKELGLPIAPTGGLPPEPNDEHERTALVLSLAADHWPRAGVVALLDASQAYAAHQVANLDRCSRLAGIEGGEWRLWERELEQAARLAVSAPERVERVAAAEFGQAAATVRELRGTMGDTSAAHPRVWRRRLKGWLSRLFGLDPARLETGGDDAPPETEAPQALAALDAWPPAGALSVEQYADLAGALLASAQRRRPQVPGTVCVTTQVGHGCGALDRVWLVGAVAGVLPRRRGETVPLDSRDLARMGVRGAGGEQAWQQEALGFRDVVGAAEQLVIVTPVADGAGEETLPSPFIEDLRRTTTWPAPDRVRAEERIPSAERALTPGELAAALVLETIDTGVPLTGFRELGLVPETVARAQVELQRMGDPAGEWDGLLPAHEPAVAAALAARFGVDQPLSPSRLEAYRDWPFEFLLSNVFGVEEEEEPVPWLDLRHEGGLFHSLHRAVLDRGLNTPAEVAALAAETLDETQRQPGLAPGVWRHAVARLATWSAALATAEPSLLAGWPAPKIGHYLEQGFGLRDGWPALTLGAGAGAVRVRGFIDRVDVTVDGCAVIDYKRSPRKRDDKSWPYQLPLYAAMVQQELGQQVVRWALLGYRDPRRSVGQDDDESAIAAAIEQTKLAVLEDVAGMRSGRFLPDPAPEHQDRGYSKPWALRAAARVIERLARENDDAE